MDEVITCVCGCQKWIIYGDKFKCSNCKYVYQTGSLSVNVTATNKSIRADVSGSG